MVRIKLILRRENAYRPAVTKRVHRECPRSQECYRERHSACNGAVTDVRTRYDINRSNSSQGIQRGYPRCEETDAKAGDSEGRRNDRDRW